MTVNSHVRETLTRLLKSIEDNAETAEIRGVLTTALDSLPEPTKSEVDAEWQALLSMRDAGMSPDGAYREYLRSKRTELHRPTRG